MWAFWPISSPRSFDGGGVVIASFKLQKQLMVMSLLLLGCKFNRHVFLCVAGIDNRAMRSTGEVSIRRTGVGLYTVNPYKEMEGVTSGSSRSLYADSSWECRQGKSLFLLHRSQ